MSHRRLLPLVIVMSYAVVAGGAERVLRVPRDQSPASQVFLVYTTDEVDQRFGSTTQSIDAVRNTVADLSQRLPREVDEKLAQQATVLRGEVVNAINALPQRVLMDAMADAFKAAIVQELRAEIEVLRGRIADLEGRLPTP